MKRINNSVAGSCVAAKEEFKSNNGTLYAEWRGPDKYVVFSYGEHYPMYIWVRDSGWFENQDPYSVTTSRHKGHCRPTNCTTSLNTEAMRALAKGE